MIRGEIWTAAAGSDYVGKPRPVVILQDDRFDATLSVTACAFTADPTEAPLFRLLVQPDQVNGLHQPSSLMVDKITTVPKSKLGDASADSALTTWCALGEPSWSSLDSPAHRQPTRHDVSRRQTAVMFDVQPPIRKVGIRDPLSMYSPLVRLGMNSYNHCSQ